jgi:hypothetical protein
MNKQHFILILFVFLSLHALGQDSTANIETEFGFKGQLSAWSHFNPDNPYPLYLGGRYIPQANYEIRLPKNLLIDFEVSANLTGQSGIHFFDSISAIGNINAYRAWGRYSTEQLEIRFGLQKIDFGTAVMLRALRWFDQVDPRDPLRLTEGVWAGLVRYYFLNNVNIWAWGLYGNKNLKGMEIIRTNSSIPEFGGRIQFPVSLGEAALSYHRRVADSRNMGEYIPDYSEIQENRIGLDAKWDLLVGIWLEAAWITKNKNLGIFTNQEIMTFGTDYTFGVGSGLNVTLEHMLFSYDETAFNFENTVNFTGLSVNYPIGMFDNISAIFYYDWTNKSMYNFVNWFRQFDKSTLYLMAYWNPEDTVMPTMGTDSSENLFGGIGIQVMYVFNH